MKKTQAAPAWLNVEGVTVPVQEPIKRMTAAEQARRDHEAIRKGTQGESSKF